MSITISTDLLEAARRSDGEPGTWDDARREIALTRYLRFLELVAENPQRPIAPTREIDEMWHLHMLAPRAYFEDCQRLFGQLLDHDGGFGKRENELPELLRVFDDTARRWQERFGEPYVARPRQEALTKCWHDCTGRCWHACSNKVEIAVAR
jgi:hypothetical protein